MEVGTLVKEKEGAQTGGVIVESRTSPWKGKEIIFVEVIWPNGEKNVYKSTFLEKIL
jgi:hypothetical protein